MGWDPRGYMEKWRRGGGGGRCRSGERSGELLLGGAAGLDPGSTTDTTTDYSSSDQYAAAPAAAPRKLRLGTMPGMPSASSTHQSPVHTSLSPPQAAPFPAPLPIPVPPNVSLSVRWVQSFEFLPAAYCSLERLTCQCDRLVSQMASSTQPLPFNITISR